MVKKVDYKKKAIKLAETITKQKGFCERCLKKDVQLQASHILPRTISTTSAYLPNLVCLCSYCHRLGPTSWHQSPVHGVRWLEKTYPGRIEQIFNYLDNKKTMPDWKTIYEDLKNKAQ